MQRAGGHRELYIPSPALQDPLSPERRPRAKSRDACTQLPTPGRKGGEEGQGQASDSEGAELGCARYFLTQMQMQDNRVASRQMRPAYKWFLSSDVTLACGGQGVTQFRVTSPQDTETTTEAGRHAGAGPSLLRGQLGPGPAGSVWLLCLHLLPGCCPLPSRPNHISIWKVSQSLAHHSLMAHCIGENKGPRQHPWTVPPNKTRSWVLLPPTKLPPDSALTQEAAWGPELRLPVMRCFQR